MSSKILCQSNYHCAFDAFDALLTQYRPVWQPSPFTEENLCWQDDHPQLYQALLALSDSELAALADEQQLQQWMSHYLPDIAVLWAWQIGAFDGEVADMPKFADVGMPGRKKQQITRFSAAVNHHGGLKTGAVVDWCSGKGFLARQLHHVGGLPVTCLEYDQILCDAGTADALRHNDNICFITQDVLQGVDPQLIGSATLHTALHACGELHISMLRTASEAQSPYIALSPCCYHLIRQTHYQPLSAVARLSSLHLDKSDLRLGVLQTVTGGERVKRLREQELIWRIAYDLLRRQVTGIEHYQPAPSMNKKWLSGSFVDYCLFMAARQKLILPGLFDAEALLVQARLKYRRIIRLEKARLVFRQAMEYWLLLDRALYLQQPEQGYVVELCLFCDTQTSPRNTLILAKRR